MKFNRFIQPNTVQEALESAKMPSTVVAGGLMWLRMQNRTVENLVDLSKLGLNKIEETEKGISLGAYVTLRQAQTNHLLLSYTNGAIDNSFSPIVGVQFRNTATVGGSVFGRFGFSDVSTLFSALGADVCLAEKGIIPMTEFIIDGAPHDILTHIILPKDKPDKFVTMAHRNSATDFPVVTVAVCKRNKTIRVTISPAPLRGFTADFSVEDISLIPELITQQVTFRTDSAAAAEYREKLARVLIKRCLEKMGDN